MFCISLQACEVTEVTGFFFFGKIVKIFFFSPVSKHLRGDFVFKGRSKSWRRCVIWATLKEQWICRNGLNVINFWEIKKISRARTSKVFYNSVSMVTRTSHVTPSEQKAHHSDVLHDTFISIPLTSRLKLHGGIIGKPLQKYFFLHSSETVKKNE